MRVARCNRPRASASASASASAPSPSPAPGAPPAARRLALTYTSYECNAFKLDFSASGARVLVDPWLVGDLVFGGVPAAFRGTKKYTAGVDVAAVAAATDVVLLTMAIDDHCHRPTLEALPRSLPVVAPPSAAAVARALGYTTVVELDHGQEALLCGGALRVAATPGALVGPPWSKRQNGYVLREACAGGASLYYEPHADAGAGAAAAAAPVDVVVTPPSTQSLLGLYDLVRGATEGPPLLRALRPAVVVPLLNAEFDASGPLHAAIVETGGVDALRAALAADPGLAGVRVCVPRPGEPMAVEI